MVLFESRHDCVFVVSGRVYHPQRAERRFSAHFITSLDFSLVLSFHQGKESTHNRYSVVFLEWKYSRRSVKRKLLAAFAAQPGAAVPPEIAVDGLL